QLRQVFAAGHNLALSGNVIVGRPSRRRGPKPPSNIDCDRRTFVYKDSGEIKNLVQIRKEYADALVDGEQEHQPKPVPMEDSQWPFVAYYYRGNINEIITVVNTDVTAAKKITLQLRATERSSTWEFLHPRPAFFLWGLLGGRLNADAQARLAVTIRPGGLIVLRRFRFSFIGRAIRDLLLSMFRTPLTR